MPVCEACGVGGGVRGGDELAHKGESSVSIEVTKISDDLYIAGATPPDVSEAWSTPAPIRGRQLTRELIERRSHSSDVGDAMYNADPQWVEKLRDPYIATQAGLK